jgi:hypothetical protein
MFANGEQPGYGGGGLLVAGREPTDQASRSRREPSPFLADRGQAADSGRRISILLSLVRTAKDGCGDVAGPFVTDPSRRKVLPWQGHVTASSLSSPSWSEQPRCEQRSASAYRRSPLRTSSTLAPLACAAVSFPSSSSASSSTAVHSLGPSSKAAWFTPTPLPKERWPPSHAEKVAALYPSAESVTPRRRSPRLRAAQDKACSRRAVVFPIAWTLPTRRVPQGAQPSRTDRPRRSGRRPRPRRQRGSAASSVRSSPTRSRRSALVQAPMTTSVNGG